MEEFVKKTNEELISKGYTVKEIQDYWDLFIEKLKEHSNE